MELLMSLVGLRKTSCGMWKMFEKQRQFHVVAGDVYFEDGK
jgi:hypothetical protein